MTNLTMSSKFMLCFGAILLLLAGSGALGVHQLSRMDLSSDEYANNLLPSAMLVAQLRNAGDARRMAESVHIITTDDAVTQQQETEITKADAAYAKAAGSFEALLDSPQDHANWKALTDARAAYIAESRHALELSRAGEDKLALDVYTGAERERFDSQSRALAKMDEYNRTGALAQAENAIAAYEEGRAVAIGSVIFGAILVVGLQFFLRGQISGPIGSLNLTMKALAAGDNGVEVAGIDRRDLLGDMARTVLVFRETAVAKAAADAEKADAEATVQMVVETLGASLLELRNRDLTGRVTAEYAGAYAVLKANFNDALDSVRSTVQQVSESARTISTGADEIAQASEDLARRTESNAASLEETSAALTQMESRLKATATASVSTVARADQAMATVDSGRSTADAAMQAMGRVSGSAKGIDDVIEGLDKIAFQTRVLAMNAAVEAGRAGDAGRGFAVVADLVSALAMRAEEEAKRARDQLSITQSEIVTAVEAVGKVDGALAAISGDVSEVNKLLAGMASDNLAQSNAITEITAAVSTMDRATQQNAAMVEETSAAARNLTQEVGTLASAAAQFVFERRFRQVPVASDRRAGGRVAVQPTPAPLALTARPYNPAADRKPKPMKNGHANGKSQTAASDWADF